MKAVAVTFAIIWGAQLLTVWVHDTTIVNKCSTKQEVTLLDGTKIHCSVVNEESK